MSEEEKILDSDQGSDLQPAIATLYRAIISFGTQETQLIWARYTGFIVINGFFVNVLLPKWEHDDISPLIFVVVLSLLVNAIWHILNFSGWQNENLWYHLASKLNSSFDKFKLPTDCFKEWRSPNGWIYWLAQTIPTLFSIGGALCLQRALSLCIITTILIWLGYALFVVVIEYSFIWRRAKKDGAKRPV
jgi:hypothetical protein